MSDLPPLSRRDLIKALGVVSAGHLLPRELLATEAPAAAPVPAPPRAAAPDGAVVPNTSTTGVFIPPRGRAFDKFSFDFPEPSVALGGYELGVMVFTHENAYGLDANAMTVEATADGLRMTCTRLIWAGGQEHADGRVVLDAHHTGDVVTWTVAAELPRPIKTITTVVRGIPRGHLSSAGSPFFDPHDNEILLGYPFSGGDLFGPGGAGGMTTPLVIVQNGDAHIAVSSLDDRVRTKRFFFQPGADGYRLEAVHELEGWLSQTRATTPTWRIARAASLAQAVAPHFAHLRTAYGFAPWDTRPDVPGWMRQVSLVVTLHGMHYTGYVFNDFARMLEILKWIAARIPGERVLVFLPSWDGRYYWDYPEYAAAPRLGGEAGLRALVKGGQALGFRFMPMFGTNAANRHAPHYARVADAATDKIDGDRLDLNWVDWDNDRHQEGWLSYMNLGVDSWRTWLEGRIDDAIRRYGVDAYFLDIAGGWVNNPRADMHAGLHRLVADLGRSHPHVLCCGEMHYDALLGFIPLYQSFSQWLVRDEVQRYARFFQHLSHPAPGRGSSGVHESGFNHWDEATLSLRDGVIPTLNIVDDTFGTYRAEMAAVIARARSASS